MSTEWRPKVGEEVVVRGTIRHIQEKGDESPLKYLHVALSNGYHLTFLDGQVEPLPAPAAPRPAWEVLEEAVNILRSQGYHHLHFEPLEHIASKLKAAAAPKPPPTLAEAVRAAVDGIDPGYSSWRSMCDALLEVKRALARAEAEAGQ